MGTLSPLARRVDEILARYDYEIDPTGDAIDDAVSEYGRLSDPATTDGEIRPAAEDVLTADPPATTERRPRSEADRGLPLRRQELPREPQSGRGGRLRSRIRGGVGRGSMFFGDGQAVCDVRHVRVIEVLPRALAQLRR